MYEIRPESVKTYLDDRKIFFPRFQRKQTWDDKKNFKLCISVFKNYPVGVVVINREEYNNNVTKWLLDGRQRRNALMRMMEDVEEIYKWGKKFIKIHKNDQPDKVIEKFWNAIDEHLEKDVDNGNENDSSEDGIEESEVLVAQNDNSEVIEEVKIDKAKDDDLQLLLNIMLIVHNQGKIGSGFTRPFDFRKYIDNLTYVDNTENGVKLNCKKLRLVILEFNKKMYDEGKEDFSDKDFYEFIVEKFNVPHNKRSGLSDEVEKKWNLIKERIKVIDLLENKLRETIIGIIELKNASLIDAQNIFKLINSEGTQLTSEEILSSKPYWNIQIKNPSDRFKLEVKELYKILKVKIPDTVVRWDFPATLISRLENCDYLIKNLDLEKDNEFKVKLTLGFKLMSAIYQNGINKNCVADIAKNKEIKWKDDIEELVIDLNLMFKVISEIAFFKYFRSWKVTLMDITSDAVLINFITIMYKDWIRKGKPVSSGAGKFQKNAIILFDKLVYEYIMKQWRGSSDSKVANNIKNFNYENEIFEAVSDKKWEILIKEAIDDCKINDNLIKNYKELKPILIYYYCLNNIAGPNDIDVSISIDHIYPQDMFESSTLKNKDIIKDNLCNLMLLPKKSNSSKSNKKLKYIEDKWLIDSISKYSGINEVDFEKYSDLNNFDQLKEYRKGLFIDTFTKKRIDLLNN